MSYSKTHGKTLNQAKICPSEDTELIPVEDQANFRHNEAELINILFPVGYTIDDEGLINNFAIESGVYPSEYPSPRQQWQYIVSEATVFFVAMLLLTAVLVS